MWMFVSWNLVHTKQAPVQDVARAANKPVWCDGCVRRNMNVRSGNDVPQAWRHATCFFLERNTAYKSSSTAVRCVRATRRRTSLKRQSYEVQKSTVARDRPKRPNSANYLTILAGDEDPVCSCAPTRQSELIFPSPPIIVPRSVPDEKRVLFPSFLRLLSSCFT